jgi:hypothetical protein
MKTLTERSAKLLLRRFGYDIVPYVKNGSSGYPPDFEPQTIALFQRVQPFTMTSCERVFALCRSVEYVANSGIPGDIVECGVWKGGSMMAVAHTLLDCGTTDRKLYLFDTFDGMTEPTAVDKDMRGQSASELMKKRKAAGRSWCRSTLEEVETAMKSTGYDEGNMVFVKGKVEETIPERAPEKIALLRLDTDWYESTYHELKHLYPRLSVGGVLIVDDYGYWNGARRAVDQFMRECNGRLLLNRIDHSARICVKLDP